jgi:tetratricopeptide (TPR) repeat protein
MPINPSLSENDINTLIDQICRNIEEGDLDKAMSNTDHGLSSYPANPHFLNFKGSILSYQDDFNEALVWLLKSEKAFETEKEDELTMVGKIENWINLTSAFVYLKDIKRAFLSIYKAISCYGEKEYPLVAIAYFWRSQLHILNDSTSLAVDDLQKAKHILEIYYRDSEESGEYYETILELLNKYSKV